MSGKNVTNIAASVRAKLYRLSKERQEDFNLMLVRYGSERLLYRLGNSEYRERFVLKGALLLQVYWSTSSPYRPTRDIDLLGFGASDKNSLREVFQRLCEMKEYDDGIEFDPYSIAVEDIRENDQYGGIRARMNAFLSGAKIPLQIDIGFGDVVAPNPEVKPYPTLLDGPEPRILMYPIESVIAEKLEAILSIGILTSRMKDFYDLFMILETFTLDSSSVRKAIVATFQRRNTPLPSDVPEVLTGNTLNDDMKVRQWNAFLRRIGMSQKTLLFGMVIGRLRTFVEEVLL